MSAAPAPISAVLALASEPTAIGEQVLVAGVAPITPRERLAFRANASMEPRKPQRAADHANGIWRCSGGASPPRALFDLNSRLQIEMFGGKP